MTGNDSGPSRSHRAPSAEPVGLIRTRLVRACDAWCSACGCPPSVGLVTRSGQGLAWILSPRTTRGDLLPECSGHPATPGLEQLPSSTPAEAPPALDGDYVQAQSSFPLETWTHLPVSAQQAELLCSRVPWKEAHRNRSCDGRCPSRETLRGGDPHLCAVWAAGRVFREQKGTGKGHDIWTRRTLPTPAEATAPDLGGGPSWLFLVVLFPLPLICPHLPAPASSFSPAPHMTKVRQGVAWGWGHRRLVLGLKSRAGSRQRWGRTLPVSGCLRVPWDIRRAPPACPVSPYSRRARRTS